MKRIFLFGFLAGVSASIAAQQQMKTAFAITGQSNGNYSWTDVREINLNDGSVVNTIFESNKSKYTASNILGKAVSNTYENQPMYAGVAAAAYDRKSGRLFYTPMHSAQLRYIDLNKKDLSFVYDVNMLGKPENFVVSEPEHITRMTINANGLGYAITNDASHLLMFTTGKKIKVTDLGAITDAPGNAVSFLSKCTSWGGDMVADAYGNLWVVSARQHVFMVNVENKLAEYKGQIKGLPADYTTNAMAVDADGKLVLGSANVFTGFYVMDPKTFEAKKIETKSQVFNVSDMANSNFLFQKEAEEAARAKQTKLPKLNNIIVSEFASVYPNPVFDGSFKINFSKTPVGVYNLVVSDLRGSAVLSQKINVAVPGQIDLVRLPKISNGMYIISIVDAKGNKILSDKLNVQ